MQSLNRKRRISGENFQLEKVAKSSEFSEDSSLADGRLDFDLANY